jgi:hypothetical protein
MDLHVPELEYLMASVTPLFMSSNDDPSPCIASDSSVLSEWLLPLICKK